MLTGFTTQYQRDVIRGVLRFCQMHGNLICGFVEVENAQQGAVQPPHMLQVTGIIGAIFPGVFQQIKSLNLPMVNVSNRDPVPGVPRVGVQDDVIGNLAAEHFIERGFRNFAMAEIKGHAYSIARAVGYRKRLEQEGHSVHFAPLPKREQRPRRHAWSRDPDEDDMADWLVELPKPVGVFTANDLRGYRIISLCQQLGLRVPEQVAVLGVDNDDIYVCGANPPLSSIDVPGMDIGHQAAALLLRMLNGETPPAEPILLPPGRVMTRQSTDIVAVSDPDLCTALAWLRENAHRPINIDDLVEHMALSRTWIEKRFRDLLGRSPARELLRVRVAMARTLLLDTQMSLNAIALRAGFGSTHRLIATFRREVGKTPGDFRKHHRLRTVSNRLTAGQSAHS